MKAIDLSGCRFGKVVCKDLVILKNHRGHSVRAWVVQCDCGGSRVAKTSSLRCGDIKSCGCLFRKRLPPRPPRPARSPNTWFRDFPSTYICWSSMRRRVVSTRESDAVVYANKGITICERWSRFSNFLDDMGVRPSLEHTLDRIDSNLGYTPENCRWATITQQARNKRNNLRVTINGVSLCAMDVIEQHIKDVLVAGRPLYDFLHSHGIRINLAKLKPRKLDRGAARELTIGGRRAHPSLTANTPPIDRRTGREF